MTRIIVDAMGGDNAPKAIVDGCVKAVADFDIKITLVGNEELINACLGEYDKGKINVVNATDIITNDDDPAKAIRRKKDSSIVVAMNLLADGQGDAFVSAGSTGAVVSGATFAGSDKAQITFKSFSFAAFLSIPPGFDATSIKTASFFTKSNLSLSRIWKGIVLIIISNFPKFSFNSFK